MGNFSFLLKNDEYESFSKPCIEAENMIATSTVATAFMARRALEQAVHWIYSHDSYLKAPYRATLSSLVWDDDFRDIVDSELHKQIVLLIRWGNHAAHGGEIKEREAILALHHLYQFVNFIDYCYSNEFVERYFDEKCLPLSANIKYRETPQSMIKLQDSLPELPDFHEQMAAQSVEVQETYTEKRETAAQRQDVPFHIDQLSEAETRKLFIDIDLRLAGWIFEENCRVEIAVDGLKHGSGIGYCDYVLYGKNGKILAIVEAKKASVNPEVGEVQVKEYAEALEKHIGYQPICFITNGLKHYILDGPNRRQIAGFYSQEELQLVMDRRHLQKPLEDISSKIRDDISGRHYQKHAIASVCEAFSNHRRQALLVMATGAGKTRTAVSLVDILSRHNDDLSEEEKEHFDSKFEDDSCEKDIDGSVFNSFIFNKSTVEIVLNELMTRGIQTASGDEIGKTIIFAKNHDHAEYIRGIFNNRYPEKGSDYAQVIDYSIKHYQTVIDDFKIKEKYPQIAISVDMLDTGIDVPEVVNLVFFKKVRSKTKFWQMIGRGTRLCKDLFGPEQDKENFLVFDYGDNFDYFRADPRDGEGRHIVSLTQRLFNIKVDLIRELQGLQYQEDQFARAYRQQLVSELQGRIESLNELDFRVRMVLDTVYSYRKLESWQNLTTVTSETIQKNLSPLLFDEDKEDEMARRFDLWLLHIQLGQLTAKSSTVHISQVMKTARALSAIGNIPQVFEQAEIIRKVQEPEFWKEVNLSDLEKIRLAIRDLLQFLDKTDRKPYYVNFEDRILSTVHETTAFLQVNDLRSYNEKVEHYLKTHLDEESISKLYHNKKLTSDDMLALEKLLWEKLGSKADYQSHYENKAIPRLVREIIGLDRESANRIFSKFLSDENLNARQISFVKLIVDYIVENGFLETKVLTQEPFKSYGSVQLLFQHQLPVLRNIVQIIELINNRAGEAA
ncbi:DEAD/DEAH box helicase family protein [Streptococcus pneumoniae]|nr:DEAD/DEAH box helicase family protein [Streptococcus pneumoniae]